MDAFYLGRAGVMTRSMALAGYAQLMTFYLGRAGVMTWAMALAGYAQLMTT